MQRSEIFFLNLGLRLAANPISQSLPKSEAVLIRVIRVEYNPTDYQPEGLVYAITGWAAEAFRFPKLDTAVHFDMVKGRYTFPFKPWRDDLQSSPGADQPTLRQTAIDRVKNAQSLLRENRFRPAVDNAEAGVWLALKALLPTLHSVGPQSTLVGVVDLDVVLMLLSREDRTETMPTPIGRDLTRIRTWYPDLRLEANESRRREVEELVASADRIVGWANAKAKHDST